MNKRIIWLDILRIFSILSMIMLHVAATFMYKDNVSSFNFIIMNIFDSNVRFCVPIFIMISGALFLSKKEINIKKLYTKNIIRILIALIFWNFLYAIFLNRNLLIHPNINVIGEIIKSACTWHYHLNFLLGLTGLYILSPVLSYITKNKKIFKYLLITSCIFGILIPTICKFPTLLNEINGNNKYYIIFNFITNPILNIQYINIGSGYLAYFLLGYFLYNINYKKYKKILYILGILGFFATIGFTQLFSHVLNIASFEFYQYSSINVFVEAVAIFTLYKYEISRIKISNKIETTIVLLSNCCFGIYLIHDLFLQLFSLIGFNAHMANPIISIPIVTIVVFIISFLPIFVISKIPLLNKYII